jgi:hypothetical protein
VQVFHALRDGVRAIECVPKNLADESLPIQSSRSFPPMFEVRTMGESETDVVAQS